MALASFEWSKVERQVTSVIRTVVTAGKGTFLLSFRYFFQRRKECRIGNCGRFGSADHSLAPCAQRRNCERHGDAMIAKGIEFRAMKRLSAGNLQPIFALFDFGAH